MKVSTPCPCSPHLQFTGGGVTVMPEIVWQEEEPGSSADWAQPEAGHWGGADNEVKRWCLLEGCATQCTNSSTYSHPCLQQFFASQP